MKKISFKDLDLFDLEKLSRNDLKKITGGSMDRCGADFGPCPSGLCCSNYGYCGTGPDYCMDVGRCYTNTESCTLVVQSTSGGWNTYYGVCSGGDSCFCDIGQPVDIPITSNGGVSRCTIQ